MTLSVLQYTTPDTIAAYSMDYHGIGVLSLLSDDGTWRHIVASKSHPAQPHRVTVRVSGGYLEEWHCTCPAFTLSPKTDRRCCGHSHAAAVAQYSHEDDLNYCASLRRSWLSAEDWQHADELENRIRIWRRGETVKEANAA